MFENVGGRIKTLAIIIFFIEAIATILTPIILVMKWYFRLLIIFGGLFVEYFGFALIYGFGHLVENSEIVATDTLAKNPELRNVFDRDKVIPEVTSTEKIKEMRQKRSNRKERQTVSLKIKTKRLTIRRLMKTTRKNITMLFAQIASSSSLTLKKK